MSVFARSDVGYVAVPATSGGCGESHRRPTDAEGALVKVWELDCPQCGNYLRRDPHWGGMISEIPETPDEVRIREDEEKRGQRETAAATSHALVQIADLPNGMATAFAHAFAQNFSVDGFTFEFCSRRFDHRAHLLQRIRAGLGDRVFDGA